MLDERSVRVLVVTLVVNDGVAEWELILMNSVDGNEV